MFRQLGPGSGGHAASSSNPLSANANALKKSANQTSSSAKNEHRHDDLHELVGSNSPTPSGVETPRPDLHDKRFPGIMHNYFGQVGRDPSQNAPLRSCQAGTNPKSKASEQSAPSLLKEKEEKGESRRGSSASLGSMVMVERQQHSVPTPPPEEPHQVSMRPVTEIDPARLPPTPESSAASVVNRDGEVAENGGSMLDGGLASITQALRNFVLPKSASSVKDRRHQSLPVSSVTKSTVPAAHISNPTSSTHSSRPHSPRSLSPSLAKPPSEILKESDELTSNVASAPREKSTPPHTPRALSQEDYRRADTRSPLSSTSTTVSDGNAQAEKQIRAKDQIPTAPTTPRGKLKIKIAEGRNLKPSFDPYVVCQFEWNEYVSKGVRNDKMDVDDDDRKDPVSQLQSIPIRRTDSDMGKPMAIPMKSRQSSTNGIESEDGLNKVTDPQWDHDAIL